jgi:putative SOS response-associated peptidase YedK
MSDNTPLPLAGLWESWKSPDGTRIETCTILTTEACSVVAKLHDRMPVIVHPSEIDFWLDKEVDDVNRFRPLFQPYPSDRLVAHPVTPEVNSPAHDHPGLIVPK